MFGDDLAAYLPDHIKPFAEQLKQFPKDFEKWVYASSPAADTYQGDVFAILPFAHVDDDGDVVRADHVGMVISNTCDIQIDQSAFVVVAAVIALDDYRKQSELKGEELENHIRAVVDNKLSQIMFLPETQGFGSALVDFGNVCSISTQHFHATAREKKIVSLSQYGHYFLLVKLSYHLTRPEAADAKRV